MTCFVTGILATNDIAELEKVLGGLPNVDRSKLQVIVKTDRTYEHDSSFLNFLHVGGPQIDSDAIGGLAGKDTAIMTSGGGTGVPGLTAGGTGLGYLGDAEVVQTVGTLPIPGDEADNYNDALEDGRTVVAYECADADAAAVEAALHQAGLRKVKTFKR